jgi:uncharacterized membrane protein YkoI
MTDQKKVDKKKLTIKQENFCLAYLDEDDASDAYRKSYDTSKMNEASINREAKRLMDNPKIATRLAELRKPAIEAAQITLTDHLNDLKRLRDLAERDGKYSAAVAAEAARGKASGLYTDKVDLTSSDGTMSPKGKSLSDFYTDVSVK